MQTDTVFACYLEIDDFIVEDGESWQIQKITDSGDALAILAKDEEGATHTFHRPPFEHMHVVTSFDEDFSYQDIDIDA